MRVIYPFLFCLTIFILLIASHDNPDWGREEEL